MRKVYYWFEEHYFIKSIIIAFNGVYGFLLAIGQPKIFFDTTANSYQLTMMGYVVFGIGFLLFLFITINDKCVRRKIKSEDTVTQLQYNEIMRETVYSSIAECIKEKRARFINFIGKDVSDDFLKETMNPMIQISRLGNGLKESLHTLSGIKHRNISVTLAYRLEGEAWKWIIEDTEHEGLSLNVLTSNKETTFSQLIDGEKDHLFYNSKTDAVNKNVYIADGSDKAFQNNDGSIYCKKVILKRDDSELLYAVLSISTYGEKFVDDNDKDSTYQKRLTYARENIIDIVAEFESRMKLEFSLLAIDTCSKVS